MSIESICFVIFFDVHVITSTSIPLVVVEIRSKQMYVLKGGVADFEVGLRI